MHNNFYINRNDKVRGPFSEERVRELYAEGKLRDTDFLSTRSDGGWEPVNVVLNRRPSKRATAKGKTSSTSSVKRPRRLVRIVLGVAAAAVMGVGIWKFGFSQPDVAEVATNSSVPSEIAPQSSQANAQGGRETERSITVEFEGLDGASIGWVADGKLERRQVAIPGEKEFQFNTRRQLYIDNVRLAGLEGVSFYATLEIRQLPDNAAQSPERAGIKLDLTGDDFAAANAGVLVTKVWYTKSESPTVIEILNNSSPNAGADPEAVASAEGTVVAIFHMGNRSRNLDAPALSTPKAPAQADALGSAIDQQPQTIQLRFIGLDGMSVGWMSDGKALEQQLFIPCRAEFLLGENRQLILDNIPIEGWKGISLHPKLEVFTSDPRTAAYLEHCCVPVEITEKQLREVQANSGVTHVLSSRLSGGPGQSSSGPSKQLTVVELDNPKGSGAAASGDSIVAALRFHRTDPSRHASTIASTPTTSGPMTSDPSPAHDAASGSDGLAPFDKSQAVDQAVAGEIERQRLVGVAIGIVRDSKLAYSKGYGMANLESGTPVTDATVFNWASNSKPLMAIAALQLVEKQQLDLDEPIHTYLPRLPKHLKAVTARHLLCHQSGIPHYSNGKVVASGRKIAPHQELDPLNSLDRFIMSPLIFTPGTKMDYSSHAYVLLTAVVQAAGKNSIEKQISERITLPLGLKTFQLDVPLKDQPNWSSAYKMSGTTPIRIADYAHFWKHGAGGYKSNVADFSRFAIALMSSELISEKTSAMMWTPQKTKSGNPSAFGLGVAISGIGENLMVSHSGSQDETRTHLIVYPRQKHGVVVMCNTQGAEPLQICMAINAVMNQR